MHANQTMNKHPDELLGKKTQSKETEYMPSYIPANGIPSVMQQQPSAG